MCSAPCSSCLHINQPGMGSKVNECSGEATSENAISFSVNDAVPDENIMKCEIVRKSETRNFVRGISSDTSKNVDCEAIRKSYLSATSENNSVFPKDEDPKGQEDHDHYRSCVTGAEDTKLSNFAVRNEDGLVETPLKTAGDVTRLVKAQGNFSIPAIDKSPLHGPSPDDLEDNLLECPSGHLTSLSAEVVTSGPTDSDPAVDTVDSVGKSEGIDKVMGSRSLPHANGNSFESHPKDESDDSDMMEHDVKVCDICGDAGREDLLGICCRCSDGAEHTYCMREMIGTVPVGDWLCEKCKFDVEMKNQRQEKVCSVDGSEKINSSGQENPENANFFTKSEAKGSDVVGNRSSNDPPTVKTLGKRHSVDAVVSCAAKKRVLEPDRGKAKPTQYSSSGTLTAHDIATSPASGSRLHTQGELKRQSSTSAFGVSSLNGSSGHYMKPNQCNLKEDCSSSSYSVERQLCNLNEGLPDGLSRASRSKESTNFGERAKDSIWSQSRQISMLSGRILSCQKCKEIGHLAQFCTADHPGSPASATATKNPRETVEGRDKLKAAIEAAVLRKPGLYRKHRVSDQSDDASLSNINSEITTQDQLLDSRNRGNVVASGEMQEGQIMLGNSTTDSTKQETVDDNVKQFAVLSLEASTSRTGVVFPVVPLEGLSSVEDVPNGVSVATSTLLKTLAIPDHEYIWQGVFEVNRTGKALILFDGIQAHSSTCASAKVLQAVNNFDRKVLLNEVPRLTTWPVQFQEYGVKENNIAFFFFPKDLASYEECYKVLLDNMMKYDLALEGNFDGFELMIFPSNQLPEKSQRWNALFFLWGVFRGKRTNCSHVTCSDKQIFFSQGSSKSLASEVTVFELPCLSPSQALKQGCDGRVSSEVTNNDPVLSLEQQDNKPYSSSFSVVQNIIAKSCGETAQTSILCDEIRHNSTFPEDGVDSDHKIEQELQTSAECTRRVRGFGKSQQMLMDQNSHLSKQQASHYFGESLACAGGIGSVGNIGEGDILDKMISSRYQVSVEDGSLSEAFSCGIGNQIVKDNYRNHLFVDAVQRMPQAAYARRSQLKSVIAVDDISVEEVRTSKKQKTDVCQLYGANDQTSSSIEGLVSQVRGVPLGSPIQATGGDEAFDGADVWEIKLNAERYFFPVDPDPGKDVGLVGKLTPWKMSSLEEDRLQDRAPNLELALGAESKPMTQGTPSVFSWERRQKDYSGPLFE